ncbi:hypothetical protein FACS1894202_13700 [Clostridia bacterium]|nr:hypothetical protein FACS1894202_13700 [Clostridia bacterium]
MKNSTKIIIITAFIAATLLFGCSNQKTPLPELDLTAVQWVGEAIEVDGMTQGFYVPKGAAQDDPTYACLRIGEKIYDLGEISHNGTWRTDSILAPTTKKGTYTYSVKQSETAQKTRKIQIKDNIPYFAKK